MTCNDCLYYEACRNLLELLNPEIKGKTLSFTKNCKHFKNKADFVEVVECCKCKYAVFNKHCSAYSCKRREYFSEFVRPTDFCSYGERK